MKKNNTLWGAIIVVALAFVLQSCGAAGNKYGCPERINIAKSLGSN
jgi:hypothetical protein